jgi:hypothetical protein
VTDTCRLLGQGVEPGSGQFDSERSERGCEHHTVSSQDESKGDSEREPLLAPGTDRNVTRVTSAGWPLTEPPSIEAEEGGSNWIALPRPTWVDIAPGTRPPRHPFRLR